MSTLRLSRLSSDTCSFFKTRKSTKLWNELKNTCTYTCINSIFIRTWKIFIWKMFLTWVSIKKKNPYMNSLALFMWEILTVAAEWRDLCCNNYFIRYSLHWYPSVKYQNRIICHWSYIICSAIIINNEASLLLPNFHTAIHNSKKE